MTMMGGSAGDDDDGRVDDRVRAPGPGAPGRRVGMGTKDEKQGSGLGDDGKTAARNGARRRQNG